MGGALGQIAGIHYGFSFYIGNNGDKRLYYQEQYEYPNKKDIIILEDNFGRNFEEYMSFPVGVFNLKEGKYLREWTGYLDPDEWTSKSFTVKDPAGVLEPPMIISNLNVTLHLKQFSWVSNNFSNYENFTFYVETKNCEKISW
jgi:thioredoxin-related protein